MIKYNPDTDKIELDSRGLSGIIYIAVSIISVISAWLIFELTGFSLLNWLIGVFK